MFIYKLKAPTITI